MDVHHAVTHGSSYECVPGARRLPGTRDACLSRTPARLQKKGASPRAHPADVALQQVRLLALLAAFFIFLAASAWAGVVAANLGSGPPHGCDFRRVTLLEEPAAV